MDCWYPITVSRHNNYKGSDGLVYTHVYGKMKVPCGRCPACRRRKQNEWAYRMLEESKYSRLTAFVTLTYGDDYLPFSDLGVPTLFPDHLKKFFKDLRYRIGSFRYFACGEYGDKFDRPHYHFILFYNGDCSSQDIESYISRCWFYGHIKFQTPITAGRAKYCAKYSMKQVGFDYGDVVPPFARMSRRPGIGKLFLDHLNFNKFRLLDQWFVHDYQGTPYNLPRYYKEQVYSKDEIYQHSLLLEKLKNSELDNRIRESDNFFKFESNRIQNLERLFIKHLKMENYGFRYKLSREYSHRQNDYCSEFVTDEF